MDAETLKVVAQVAGIGGVALAVVLMVFREVIRKNIFTKLLPEEGYRLLRLIIVSTWSVAIVGVGAWIYTKVQAAPTVDATGTVVKVFTLSGLVTDSDNNGLGDVDVFVIGNEEHARTSGAGEFKLKISAIEGSIVNVRVAKAGFKARTENVKLPSSSLTVALTAAPVSGSAGATRPADAGDSDVGVPRPNQPRPVGDVGTGSRPRERATRTGRIYLRYTGPCTLNVSFQIGDRMVTPVAGVGQKFAVNDIPLGVTSYSVGGTIACPGVGMCSAAGYGQLDLQNEAVYGAVWQPSYQVCQVGLTRQQ